MGDVWLANISSGIANMLGCWAANECRADITSHHCPDNKDNNFPLLSHRSKHYKYKLTAD